MTAREPWFKVKVGLPQSDKIGGLPNDSARWGWVKLLAEAKTSRRMGVFASTAHAAELIGRQGKYVRDYVTVGLLHVVPAVCDRCRASYDDARDGECVVHDYRVEQRDPTNADRQADWRNEHRNGGGNGNRNAEGNGRLTRAGDDGDSDGDSSSSATPQKSDARDLWGLCLIAEELIGRWAAGTGSWAHRTLSEDFTALGFDRVADAMRAVHAESGDQPMDETTFISAVHKRLYPFANGKPSGITKRAEHGLSDQYVNAAFSTGEGK